MEKIKIYQADAFADELFKGNPAAICILDTELSTKMMQDIAKENNLSETAYIFEKDGKLNIRWFTPGCEVDLCGHATLASAHILFNHENFQGDIIEFQSKSGPLRIIKKEDLLEMDFPAEIVKECAPEAIIEKALGKKPLSTYLGTDYMAVFANESDIANFKPDFRELLALKSRGLIVTAIGDNCDFVSRWFGPQSGVDEDPVTGSAHCLLTPFWAGKLGKTSLTAKQISERGGKLYCSLDGDRVKIAGKAVTYLEGYIFI
ncbi:MAG: isomerase [Denitrovibrio sp.]|nr:MAG: isomerase [Denitrovibrio sp.]